MINMAGLAAVPALLVGSARNTFRKRLMRKGGGGVQRYKMADRRLHGQAASKSTDSANIYADTFNILYMLINHFHETWYSETDGGLKDFGRTHFNTNHFRSKTLPKLGKIIAKM
jgi:hypothetical protein